MKILILAFISSLVLSTQAVDRPRGVSLEKASFYQADREFHCLSDGKVLPFDHVNDDYCDCDDGSDEPGTSACANGLFYCENKPYKGHYLISSRVNDGICDCCDGSDEFDGAISCPNTCVEKYEKEKIQMQALRQQQAEGYKIKQEYMQQGKRAKDEKLSKLSELEREKEMLNNEKTAAETAKTDAEEPEKMALEEHKKAWEEVKAERQKVKDAANAAVAFSKLDVNSDGSVDYPELMKHKEFDIDSDGTVSEEEAKEYLEEKEAVDLTLFTEKIWPNIKEIYKPELEEKPEGTADHDPSPLPDEDSKDPGVEHKDVVEGESPEEIRDRRADEDYYDDEDDHDDDDDGEEEEDEADDFSSYNVPTTNDPLDPDVAEEDKEPPYSEETNNLIAAANEARTRFDDADRKVRDNEREISDIKKYLEIDFGPNQEFAFLKGQCFEYTDREYTYRLCPFEKSTQKSKNGGIETSLGTWGKWHGPDDDKYDTMKYENGQGCWNGPSRSSHVNLHCGSVNELTSASEPSRCEYQFEFTTPARCAEPTTMDIDHTHDEL